MKERAAYRIEVISCHVSHPPTLIRDTLSNLLQQLFFHFGRRKLLSDDDQVLDRQQPHRVLIITLKAAVYGETVRKNMLLSEVLRERLCCTISKRRLRREDLRSLPAILRPLAEPSVCRPILGQRNLSATPLEWRAILWNTRGHTKRLMRCER